KNYPCRVAIQGDPLSVVEELTRLLQSEISSAKGAQQQIDARRIALEAHIGETRRRFVAAAEVVSTGEPMTPGYVALQLREAAPHNTILVDESVTSTAFVRTLFTLNEPGTFFYAKAGSLGLALPEAVGVKLAMPDRPVVCPVGDGTAMYTIQGLWSAAR